MVFEARFGLAGMRFLFYRWNQLQSISLPLKINEKNFKNPVHSKI